MADAKAGPWRACTEKGDIPQTLYYGIVALLQDTGEPNSYAAVVTADGSRADQWCRESDIHSVMVANAHLIAAAPLLRDALLAYQRARQHSADGACDCDDDCEVALTLWATVDDLASAALGAAAATPREGRADE